MSNSISLEDLWKRAFEDPIPVEAAGYGRESTHKGYLACILDTRRWPKAAAFRHALIREGTPASERTADEEFRGIWTMYEQKFGGRKVDLLVKLRQDESPSDPTVLPIELKTDSDVDETQINAFAAEAARLTPRRPCLLFLLGTAAVRFDGTKIEPNVKAFTPGQLRATIEPFLAGAPRFVLDWADSLAMEVAREELAPVVFSRWKRGGDEKVIWKAGYRGPKNVYYYLYEYVREGFRARGLDWRWSIHNCGYNAGLYFAEGNERPLSECTAVPWFFEFNDDKFTLKLRNERGVTPQNLQSLAERVWHELESHCSTDPLAPKPIRATKKGVNKKSLQVAHWDGLAQFVGESAESDYDIEGLAQWLRKILDSFGEDGVLGRLSASDRG